MLVIATLGHGVGRAPGSPLGPVLELAPVPVPGLVLGPVLVLILGLRLVLRLRLGLGPALVVRLRLVPLQVVGMAFGLRWAQDLTQG